MLCKNLCKKYNIECPNIECRMYIDYPNDLNCSLISIDRLGVLTLQEISKRIHLTPVRINQIEKKAVKKFNLKALEIID